MKCRAIFVPDTYLYMPSCLWTNHYELKYHATLTVWFKYLSIRTVCNTDSLLLARVPRLGLIRSSVGEIINVNFQCMLNHILYLGKTDKCNLSKLFTSYLYWACSNPIKLASCFSEISLYFFLFLVTLYLIQTATKMTKKLF